MYIPEWLQMIYVWGALAHMVVFIWLAVKENESLVKAFFIGIATASCWPIFLPLILSFNNQDKNKKQRG